MSPFQKALSALRVALAGQVAEKISQAAAEVARTTADMQPQDGAELLAVQIELRFLHRYYTQLQNKRCSASGYDHAHHILARA